MIYDCLWSWDVPQKTTTGEVRLGVVYAPKDDVCGRCSSALLRGEVHKILHQVTCRIDCRLVLNCVRAIRIGCTSTRKPIATAHVSVTTDFLRSGRFAGVVSTHMGSLHQKEKTTFIMHHEVRSLYSTLMITTR